MCSWLEDYGLGQYVNLARQWVSDGQTLLSATPQDLEKVRGQRGERDPTLFPLDNTTSVSTTFHIKTHRYIIAVSFMSP